MMSATTHQITTEATPYEERVARAIAKEDGHQKQTIEQVRRLFAAGDEPGFSGDLRRAIHSGGKPLEALAAAAHVDVPRLCDFLEGAAELTSEQIRIITHELGLQLVRSIPAVTRNAK
jgi:hypothetical protein